jgi:hypothetical protein
VNFKTYTTQLTVMLEGGSIFDESATTLGIDDEGGGPFLKIHQSTGDIRITEDEWEQVIAAGNRLFETCKELEADEAAKKKEWDNKSEQMREEYRAKQPHLPTDAQPTSETEDTPF